MTLENGEAIGGNDANDNAATNEGQGGGNDANAQTETNKEIETLKAELASRDSKIHDLLNKAKQLDKIEADRERENFERKSEKEQLDELKRQVESMNRRNEISRELEGSGISVDVAEKIMSGNVDGTKVLRDIVDSARKDAEAKAIEQFKSTMRDSSAKGIPNTDKNNDDAMFDKMKAASSY